MKKIETLRLRPIMARVDLVVETALLGFFRGECADPAAVKDRTSNVKHLCGYDKFPLGWRGLSGPIRQLPELLARNLWIPAADMDLTATVADIEARLRVLTREVDHVLQMHDVLISNLVASHNNQIEQLCKLQDFTAQKLAAMDPPAAPAPAAPRPTKPARKAKPKTPKSKEQG